MSAWIEYCLATFHATNVTKLDAWSVEDENGTHIVSILSTSCTVVSIDFVGNSVGLCKGNLSQFNQLTNVSRPTLLDSQFSQRFSLT